MCIDSDMCSDTSSIINKGWEMFWTVLSSVLACVAVKSDMHSDICMVGICSDMCSAMYYSDFGSAVQSCHLFRHALT